MMISSELQNIFLPNLVWWYSKMSQSVMRNKDCLLSSRSRSQRGFIWSKYDSDYYILWTADFLATKLGLMIGYHRQELLVQKIGLLHSRSRSQRRVKMLMFIQMLFSKLLVPLQPNLVLWYSIICQSVLWKNCEYCIQGQGHSEGSKC